ncbi:M12 family metallo-peptidase [Streptomyces sp. NPDC059009]|uniref:M12 family metallo-peptidase n=1 Tax=Streptomyces sp. NPDC059009 TaxID=3346694 RepID=UPI003686C9D4
MKRLSRPGLPALAVCLTAPLLAAPGAAAAAGPDPDRPWVVRTTTITVTAANFEPLCAPERDHLPDELDLITYPYDVGMHAVADESYDDGEGSIAWSGHAEGRPEQTVQLYVTHACGGGPVALTGQADLGRYRYVAHPADEGDGRTVFEEIDTAKLPARTGSDVRPRPDHPRSASRAPSAAPRQATWKDPAQVDVAFAYTPKAAGMARKDYADDKDAVRLSAENAERLLNRALAGSGVPARVDAVAAEELTGYRGYKPFKDRWGTWHKDSEEVGGVQDLAERGVDSIGKRAQQLRATHGADLVMLVTGVHNVAGIASYAQPEDILGPDHSPYAYAASQYGGIVDHTVSHELGHLFGLHHDRRTMKAQKESPSRKYPFNTGYITQDQRWHDIMGYDSACARWCATMPRFSNIDGVAWQGQKTGDTHNRGADALKLTAHAIAKYASGRAS